jgi:Domain of unknown function (DUF4389)
MSEVDALAGRHPVLVRGRLEEPLSRWMWLVKWILLIPHYIVLAFLWMAFIVVTVAAFFAILITGRYPHALFVFNLGVMRWSWRVAYYGYSALGTDRYPPFTLAEVPEYPATLDIAYPRQLSRGLALVKWWLLALPHYLVLAIFVGGATWTVNASTGNSSQWTSASGGLISLLVLFAGVALLFAARYPRGLYDLVMGLNRWVLRVTAYAALMTDTYPPFRLDQGGAEPRLPDDGPGPSGRNAAALSPPAAGVAASPMTTGPASRTGGAGAVVALVIGVLVLLPGLALAGIGGAGLWLNAQRDGAGFVTTPQRLITSPTAAITAEDVDLGLDRGTATWATSHRLGTLRVRVTAAGGSPLFVGVAAQSAVNSWLGPVAHDQVTDIGSGHVEYLRGTGSANAGIPSAQTFWSGSSTGSGTVELRWPIQTGQWGLVIMRADGAPGVQARVDVGASIPALTGVAVGFLVAGLIVLCVGIALIALGAAKLGRTSGPVGGDGRPVRPTLPPPPGPRAAPVEESGTIAALPRASGPPPGA